MDAESFAVLRTEWAPADPDVLGPILAEVLGLVRYDAMRMAVNAQGIVAEHLPGAQAVALVARCADAGLPVQSVAQSALPRVGVPVLVRTLRLADEGLGVVLGYTGPERIFPWNALRLLSAGVIEETSGRTATRRGRRKKVGFGARMALGALVGPLGGVIAKTMERRMNDREKGRPTTLRSRAVEMADLFLDDAGAAEVVHLRLRGPDLYYEQILGADRRGDPVADFRAVLVRIAEQAQGAAVSDSLRALVLSDSDATVDARDAEFASPHELAQYNVWQLQMLLSDGADSADAAAEDANA